MTGSPGTWIEMPRLNAIVDPTDTVRQRALSESIRVAFAAGPVGTADDVIIYNANCPGAMRILDVEVFISTPRAGSTVQLRNALTAP